MYCVPLMFLLFLFSSENGINQEDIEEVLAEGVTIQQYINYGHVRRLKNFHFQPRMVFNLLLMTEITKFGRNFRF